MLNQSKKFKINFKGRAGLIYSEEKKTIKIDSELLFDPAGVTIYCDSISHWDDKEAITAKEKQRIISNVKNEFKKNGLKVDLA